MTSFRDRAGHAGGTTEWGEDVREKRVGARDAARVALGAMLVGAGLTHLTVARRAFRAQVPDFAVELSPFSKDDIVLMSGVAEIALGAALVALPQEKERIGNFAAAFFTAIFPGNLAQYTGRRDAFGLDTDGKRLGRLFLQPVLVAWAWWATRSEGRGSR